MARNVRINRGERQVPYLSNTVKGYAEQITPNGCAYGGQPEPKVPPPTGTVGAAQEPTPWSNGSWPGGNRSGE